MFRKYYLLIFLSFCLPLDSQSILDRFSLKTDFVNRPSFYASDSPFLVNRERYMFIGRTMNADVPGLFFYDLDQKNKLFFKPPIREYFSEHAELILPEVKNIQSDHLPVYISDLIFYDEPSKKMGFYIEQSHFQLSMRKSYFAVWNMKDNEIEFIKELSSTPSKGQSGYSMVLPIGFDSVTETSYFTFATDQVMKNKTSDDVAIQIMKYKDKNLVTIHSYQSKWLPYHNIVNFESGKILIQSYAEVHEPVLPEGRIYDLNTDKFLQISIPVVSYGSVFSRDGNLLYLASGQTGELRVIDTQSGKLIQKLKIGSHGHAMGFWNENEIVWVRNSGLHVYDAKTWKQKKMIPTSKFFKGNVNVSGSLLIPYSSVMIRNGFEGPGDAVGFLRLSPD